MNPGHGIYDIPHVEVRCYRGVNDAGAFLWLEARYEGHVLTPVTLASLQSQADELEARVQVLIEENRKGR